MYEGLIFSSIHQKQIICLWNLLFNKTVTLATILLFDTIKLNLPVKVSIVTLCLFLLKFWACSVNKERCQLGFLSIAVHVGFSSSFVRCCFVSSVSFAVSSCWVAFVFRPIPTTHQDSSTFISIYYVLQFWETTLTFKLCG